MRMSEPLTARDDAQRHPHEEPGRDEEMHELFDVSGCMRHRRVERDARRADDAQKGTDLAEQRCSLKISTESRTATAVDALSFSLRKMLERMAQICASPAREQAPVSGMPSGTHHDRERA